MKMAETGGGGSQYDPPTGIQRGHSSNFRCIDPTEYMSFLLVFAPDVIQLRPTKTNIVYRRLFLLISLRPNHIHEGLYPGLETCFTPMLIKVEDGCFLPSLCLKLLCKELGDERIRAA